MINAPADTKCPEAGRRLLLLTLRALPRPSPKSDQERFLPAPLDPRHALSGNVQADLLFDSSQHNSTTSAQTPPPLHSVSDLPGIQITAGQCGRVQQSSASGSTQPASAAVHLQLSKATRK